MDLLNTRFRRIARYSIQPICTPAAVSKAGRVGSQGAASSCRESPLGQPGSLLDKQAPPAVPGPPMHALTLPMDFKNDFSPNVLPPLLTPVSPDCTGGHPAGGGGGALCSVVWSQPYPQDGRSQSLSSPSRAPSGSVRQEWGRQGWGGGGGGGSQWLGSLGARPEELVGAAGPGWSGVSGQHSGPGLLAKGRSRPRGRCPGNLLCDLGMSCAFLRPRLHWASQCLPGAASKLQEVPGSPVGPVLPLPAAAGLGHPYLRMEGAWPPGLIIYSQHHRSPAPFPP